MFQDRMNVFLDLDNTIINALEEEEREKVPLDIQKRFDYKDMLGYGIRVFGRPHLQDFLDFLFDNFNVSVFTAAEQEYALFIVNNFLLTKPDRKVNYVLFRYHVDMGLTRYNAMKDMRLLWHVFKLPNVFPCNTVIIDDLKDVKEANPENTIRIDAFDVVHKQEVNLLSLHDTELLRVKLILTELNNRYKHSGCARSIYLGRTPTCKSPFEL